MRNTHLYTDKKITIVGLARSGFSCANLLHQLGAQVSITDSSAGAAAQANRGKLVSERIAVELGTHTPAFIQGRDLVVISPGVPDTAPPIRWAVQQGIPVVSEVEIAWQLCPCRVVAITGSNGKTTVTTLIGRVAEAAGMRSVVCGNIGNPFSGEVSRLSCDDVVVLEISSFQLEHIVSFRPQVAVVTNLNPNHLDRYPGMREYADAKKRICLNQQPGDFLVLNAEDQFAGEFAAATRATPVFFRAAGGLNPNQAAVAAAAGCLGISDGVCRDVFGRFRGIEHRMEEVARHNGVVFINDSKATTVESCQWALRTLEGPVVLIAGGRHKGLDYRPLLEQARGKVAEVVVIGEARELIKADLGTELTITQAGSLEEAVERAYRAALPAAVPQATVLLSPMCASYDMFDSYEHRGRVFKDIVNRLVKETRIGTA